MRTLFFICFLLIQASLNAQVYKDVILNDGENEIKVEEVKIDKTNNQLTYLDSNQNTITNHLSDYKTIKYKKGSYWLAGMGGGFVGSIIGSLAFQSGEGEWWHGAGPGILVGTGLGALVGSLTPKYKSIDISKNSSIEVTPVAIRFKF